MNNFYTKLLLYTGLALLTCFQFCRTGNQDDPGKPNLLFIMVDDLGKEWIGAYGAEDIQTPTIDRLAEEGMLFENAWSMPQCTPSRVALLTGQYPWRNGWINHYDVPRWGHGAHFDPERYPGLARVMKTAGYVTCAAGKWQVSDFRLDPGIMIKHGFDEYCMWTGAEGGNEEASQERYWDPYIHTAGGSRTYEGRFGEDVFTDFIIDFMKKHLEEPMMIYYPMCLPHGPLTTTPLEPDVSGTMEMHKAMVRYIDHILARLLEALEDLDIREETIIFWTTDNGSSSGIVGHRNGQAVRGGKSYLSENGVNAPFIVNCPGLVPGGVVTDALTDFTDILPTFADLGGAVLPEEYEIDGHSMADLLLGHSDDSPRQWILTMGSNPASIRDGRVASVFGFRDRAIRDKQFKAYVDTNKTIVEIFDLSADPGEHNNLLGSERENVRTAYEKFSKVVEALPDQDASPIYTRLEGSLYDIQVEKLNSNAFSGRARSNKSPEPRYEEN
jgi:arylsulfatase A-like enzyme